MSVVFYIFHRFCNIYAAIVLFYFWIDFLLFADLDLVLLSGLKFPALSCQSKNT